MLLVKCLHDEMQMKRGAANGMTPLIEVHEQLNWIEWRYDKCTLGFTLILWRERERERERGIEEREILQWNSLMEECQCEWVSVCVYICYCNARIGIGLEFVGLELANTRQLEPRAYELNRNDRPFACSFCWLWLHQLWAVGIRTCRVLSPTASQFMARRGLLQVALGDHKPLSEQLFKRCP